MSAAALPKDEQPSPSAPWDFDMLDTAPCAALDTITRAAALACRVPVALISLADGHRHRIKAHIGLDGVTETRRLLAFCARAMLSDGIFEAADAGKPDGLAETPMMVGDPAVRAYAGAPIILDDGSRVGTLSVISRRPRRLSTPQRGVLTALARTASLALGQWRIARQQDGAERRLRESQEFLARTGELAGVGGWSLDLITGKLTWTDEIFRIYGLPVGREPPLDSVIGLYQPAARPVILGAIENAKRTGESWDHELPLVREDGQLVWVRSIARVTQLHGKPVRLTGALQDITERVNRVRALQESQERAALAMDSGKIGIWDWDVTTGEKTWSPLMFQLYGLPPDSTPPTVAEWAAMLHPEDRERATQALRDGLAGRAPYSVEFRVVWDDGSVHHLRAAGSVTRDGAGRATHLTGANWDVTESHELTRKLAHQHEVLLVTLQSIGDGVITTDAAGLTAWMNPVAERMTGWTAAQAQGHPLKDVLHIINEETREAAPSPLERSGAPCPAIRTILVSRSGEEFGIEESASPMRSASGESLGFVLVFRDVTAQRRLSGEMTFRATHDSLTGLLNRGEFETRLRHTLHTAQADRKQSVMLFIDLDEFKLVNDTCGHDAGDQLLRQVARLLGELVRGSDSVARLGGDEFAVLLDRCTVERAEPLARKICERMEDYRFTHNGRRFRIGASIGLVPVDERWPEINGIMQAADASCYAAKENGRNRVHQWSDTDKAMNARHGEMKWATRLAEALDENRFLLYAQRIEGLQRNVSARPAGIHAEVLLRKVARDGTMSLPGAFLPAAERFHIISRVDRWVLDHVIAWMAGIPLLEAIDMLSVNLSGQSVGDAAFHHWAMGQLAAAGPAICHRLCLEITETAAVTNLADAARFIERVRELGVRVALDDFGAGASSFGYLKTLPVDILKIDGQFVRDLVSDPLDQAAVRSFTDVARVAGMRTIAEFVDNHAVMEKLRAMGVDYAQGYLIHKPAPIDELLSRSLPKQEREAAFF